MIHLKRYTQANPLIDLEYKDSVSEQPGERGNIQRMTKAAGTEEALSFRKQTDSYFKIIKENWVPEIIGNWDLPYRIYQAGALKDGD